MHMCMSGGIANTPRRATLATSIGGSAHTGVLNSKQDRVNGVPQGRVSAHQIALPAKSPRCLHVGVGVSDDERVAQVDVEICGSTFIERRVRLGAGAS